MTFYINGRFLTQRITGVQRFAIEIIKEMDKIIDSGNKIVVLVPPEKIINNVYLNNLEIKQVGKLKGNAWIQISLPYYVHKHKGILLTLSGLCPLLDRGYWTVHDITFIRRPESFDWKFRLIYRLFYNIALPKCKGIFTVSEFSKNEISSEFRINPKKIIIIYNSGNYLLENRYEGVDISKFGVVSGEYYLSVSSRNKHKNQIFITNCAKKYLEKKFVIVGGVNRSFNYVDEVKLKNLIYTGYVSDNELASLYIQASGFIFPSLYEGFGIPPLEAIVLGCKHIALSDIPVFRELYDNAYFFDAMKCEEFSLDKFEEIMISSLDREKYIEKYSYKKGAIQYLQVLLKSN